VTQRARSRSLRVQGVPDGAVPFLRLAKDVSDFGSVPRTAPLATEQVVAPPATSRRIASVIATELHGSSRPAFVSSAIRARAEGETGIDIQDVAAGEAGERR
jgi:hypothetical protein